MTRQPTTISKRQAFLQAGRKGSRTTTPAMVILLHDRGDSLPPRFGYTASRRIGGAVLRNRAKRRMRAIARDFLLNQAPDGHDIVLIARQPCISMGFAEMASQASSRFQHLARKTA